MIISLNGKIFSPGKNWVSGQTWFEDKAQFVVEVVQKWLVGHGGFVAFRQLDASAVQVDEDHVHKLVDRAVTSVVGVEADDERGWRLDIKIRSGHSPNYDLLAFLPSRIIVKKCNLL